MTQDLSRLLDAIAAEGGATTDRRPTTSTVAGATSVAGTLFLAWTTSDLAEERAKLRPELEARNYTVVPRGAPPFDAAGVREETVAALRDAKVAIHLIGAHYGDSGGPSRPVSHHRLLSGRPPARCC